MALFFSHTFLCLLKRYGKVQMSIEQAAPATCRQAFCVSCHPCHDLRVILLSIIIQVQLCNLSCSNSLFLCVVSALLVMFYDSITSVQFQLQMRGMHTTHIKLYSWCFIIIFSERFFGHLSHLSFYQFYTSHYELVTVTST